MKTKTDFVTNSSSTAFIIYNNTDKKLDLIKFVKENPQLIDEFKTQYDWYGNEPLFTQENLIESAKNNNEKLKPGANYVVFGDEQGTLIGRVFDYILRDGGYSESFNWRFCEYLR